MKTAAAYIRVSTEEQTELSPDSQIKLIREYAKKNDFIVPDEFIFHDDGISGRTTAKRPGFNKMIGTAKLKPKPFDAILLWKFSRFARNREDSIVYKSMLRKLGIDVISISENVGDDKMSVLIEAMIEAMDEYYSINLAEEVRRGMTEKFQRGLKVSAPPIGYDMKDGEFVVNEDEAELVQRIFDMYVNDDFGSRKIAEILNSEGRRTRKGNQFEDRTIKYILGNPTYIGKQRWTPGGGGSAGHYRSSAAENVIYSDGNHKPIIDKELFDKTQEKANKYREKYQRTESTIHEFMLRGLLKCSCCGSNLTMSSGGNSVQCYKYAHGKCQQSHYISLNKVNQLVIDDIKSLVEGQINDNKIKVTTRKPKTDKNVSKLNEKLEREKIKLERVKTAYADGIDTLEEYKQNKSKILAEIKRTEKQLADVPEDKSPTTKELIPLLKIKAKQVLETITSTTASEEEKNKSLRTIVDKIVFDRSKSCVHIFYVIDYNNL